MLKNIAVNSSTVREFIKASITSTSISRQQWVFYLLLLLSKSFSEQSLKYLKLRSGHLLDRRWSFLYLKLPAFLPTITTNSIIIMELWFFLYQLLMTLHFNVNSSHGISLLLRSLGLFYTTWFLLAASKPHCFAESCLCHLSPSLIWISVREKAFGKAWEHSASQ